MTTKNTKETAPPLRKSQMIFVQDVDGGSMDRSLAELAASPHMGAAIATARFSDGALGDVSLMQLALVLKERAATINGGDLHSMEAALNSQAVALNMIFAELARRAALNLGQNLDRADKLLRLSLKAQSQCRTTLETLAAIKNPPVIFARQANFNNGQQQINNTAPAGGIAPAGKIQTQPNKLLEQQHANIITPRMDARAAQAAEPGHPAVGTVESVHRAENS